MVLVIMIVFANALFLKLRDKLGMLRMVAAPGMTASEMAALVGWLLLSRMAASGLTASEIAAPRMATSDFAKLH